MEISEEIFNHFIAKFMEPFADARKGL